MNFEIIQVYAAKHNARRRRGGTDAHRNRLASMKADTGEGDGVSERSFLHNELWHRNWWTQTLSLQIEQVTN
jgi:hypothetical protein